MRGQENNCDTIAQTSPGHYGHSLAGSRTKSRTALSETNSRPSSALGSYEKLHAFRKLGQRRSDSHRVGGLEELALSEQEQELQRSLQRDDVRLQQLRKRLVPQTCIIHQVVASTGQGCKSVIPFTGVSNTNRTPWTTRSHRMVLMESSCILELQSRRSYTDVCVHITFADSSVVPAAIQLSHAASATTKFQPLGEIELGLKSLRQLRHRFKLGQDQIVHRMLQITCAGWLAQEHAGMHRVLSLNVTGILLPCNRQCQESADKVMNQNGCKIHLSHLQQAQQEYSDGVTTLKCSPAAAGSGHTQIDSTAVSSQMQLEASNTLHDQPAALAASSCQTSGVGHLEWGLCCNPLADSGSSMGKLPADGWQPNPLFGASSNLAVHISSQHGSHPAATVCSTCQPTCMSGSITALESLERHTANCLPAHHERSASACVETCGGMPGGTDSAVLASAPQPSSAAHATGMPAIFMEQSINMATAKGLQALNNQARSGIIGSTSLVGSHAEACCQTQQLCKPSGKHVAASAPGGQSSCSSQAACPRGEVEALKSNGCHVDETTQTESLLSSHTVRAVHAEEATRPLPNEKNTAPPPHAGQPAGVAPPPPPLPPPRPGKAQAAPPPPPPPPQSCVSASSTKQPHGVPKPPPPPSGAQRSVETSSNPAHEREQDGDHPTNQEGMPTPKKPMVKLFWSKLPANQVHGTVWNTLADVDAEVDYLALEESFAAKATVQVAGGVRAAPSKKTLLPIKRSENIGIFLRKLKLPHAQLMASIMKLMGEDQPAARDLTEDEISGLLFCLPTPEERKLLEGYKGPMDQLAAVEQFLLQVKDIPALELGLKALGFRGQFEARAARVHGAGENLLQACQEVQDCTLLAEILKVSLLVGNFLNAGNRNGAAAGFQIDALLKLKDVKSTRSRSSTLLHFVAREVARHHPGDSLSLAAGLPSCKIASKLSLSAMRSELAELGSGLNQVSDAASQQNWTFKFRSSLGTFHAEAQHRLAELREHMSSAEEAFRSLGSFLNGQRSIMCEPQAFFGVLQQFSEELEAAHKQNLEADEAAAKKAKKQQDTKSPAARASTRTADASSPLRQRDRVLRVIRVFSRLHPNQRKELLTEKGSVERVKKLKLKRRHSMTMERPDATLASPRTASLKTDRPIASTTARQQLHSTFSFTHAPILQQAALRSRPASPITVQLPLHCPTTRPGSSPAKLHSPGCHARPAGPKEGSTPEMEGQGPAGSMRAQQVGPSTTHPSGCTSPHQGNEAEIVAPETALQLCVKRENGSAVKQMRSTGLGTTHGLTGGNTHVAIELEEQGQLPAPPAAELCQTTSLTPPLPATTPAAYAHVNAHASLATAASGVAKLQLSGTNPSPPARQAGPFGWDGRQGLREGSPAVPQWSHPLQETPPGHMGQTSSQRSLTLSPSSTPLGALGRRKSSGLCEATPADQAGGCSPVAWPGAGQEQPGDLQPQPSLMPEGMACLEAGPASGAAPSGSSGLRAVCLEVPSSSQQEAVTLERRPPAPCPLAPQASRHARSASCDGSAALHLPTAAKPRKRVTFSLPSSPQRAAMPIKSGVPHTRRATLDSTQLATLLHGVCRSGLQHPAHQESCCRGVTTCRHDDSMEDLLRSVHSPRVAEEAGCPEAVGSQEAEPGKAGRGHSYDRAVERAMAAVIASAGSSPTGPLGQGLRASQPGRDIVGASQRASWSSMRLSKDPVMPRPLGQGVRTSATLLRSSMDLMMHSNHSPPCHLGVEYVSYSGCL